ncbi:MAG: arylsulfatase [Pseudomonadota bacterium]
MQTRHNAQLRSLMFAAVTGISICFGCSTNLSHPPSEHADQTIHPNIILIMADDLGYGELGSYGQIKILTPRLDEMAARGVRFNAFYSGSTLCAPSRETLMRGLHSGNLRRSGNQNEPLASGDETIAQLLRAEGYRTAMIGKWALGEIDSTGRPDLQGFDHWYGFLNQNRAHAHYPDYLWRNGKKISFPENQRSGIGVHSNQAFLDEAIDLIRLFSSEESPFFLYIPITLPHADILAPEEFVAPYRGRWTEEPYAGNFYADQSEPMAATAGMITMIDSMVGSILDELATQGLEQNTLVIFTSDNGPVSVGGRDHLFFNATGGLRGAKRDLYEGGIRVPMIALWEGHTPAGEVVDEPAALYEFKATLAELLNVAPARPTDGDSFLPLLLGEDVTTSEAPLFWEVETAKLVGTLGEPDAWGNSYIEQAIRLGRWKLVRRSTSDLPELYDLVEDRFEERNLVDTELTVRARLIDLLDAELGKAARQN